MPRVFRRPRLLILGGSLVLWTSLTTAQTPPSGQTPLAGQGGERNRSMPGAQSEVTATGCLQRAGGSSSSSPSSSSPGSQSPAGGASAGGFMLKNATATSGTGTTGTSPGGAAASGAPTAGSADASGRRTTGGGKELRLVAGPGASLDEHVGHQVEVRGRLSGTHADSPSSSAGAGNPSSSTGAVGEASSSQESRRGGMSGRVGTLHVSFVRMISSSCSAGPSD
jgi:eukaryotic-like serine/threonine-protein kinase